MKPSVIAATAAGLCIAGAAFAQGTGGTVQTGVGNLAECTVAFRRLDRNNDGKLNAREASGSALPTDVKRVADGSILEADFVSACAQIPLGSSSQ